MALAGQVTVLSGDFEIEQLPEGSVAVSSSVVEVDQEGNALTEKLPFDVSMNIQLRVLKHLKISGSTINVTLGGDLRLQQQPGRPLQLFGQLNTIGGEVRAYQQSLVVRRGTLSFSGPPANPNIDVRAERQIAGSDVSVGMRVQGPLEEDLLLDIYSIPVMSQADAISYLVRGRPADTGAGADGTALALSLASGVVNRSSLVSELNRIPGISRVEFGAQEIEDDTAATVSGYVGSRIYLSYGFGLYEPVNVLTARLYLNARLWFEVVSSLENSADLYYSFDIK
jgi:autotransporter translocation and assembly factor TamB